MLTHEQIAKAFPPNLKGAVNDNLVNTINAIESGDPLVAEQIRDNFISYTGVLREGKFKTEDYLNAVAYVSYKLMGMSNHDAYMRTFPQRYQDLLAKGTASKDIAAYVTAYNRGKLVNLILDQSMVPTWVLNQDLHQKAINVQADLMLNANSEKVRMEAANSLLTHLKRPEATKVDLNIGIKENSGLNELKETLKQLAQTQIELIEGGMSPKQIAAQPLIEGEFKET